MKSSQLQSFVAVAGTASCTEAAYALDMTQSAVSHALSALEGELGVILLERNRKAYCWAFASLMKHRWR